MYEHLQEEYPQQLQGYGQGLPTVVGQPQQITTIVQPMTLGPDAVDINCPSCGAQVTTSTRTNRCSFMPWAYCGAICLLGLIIPILWLGCCLIPFCQDDLYDVEHSCPNCYAVVGQSRP